MKGRDLDVVKTGPVTTRRSAARAGLHAQARRRELDEAGEGRGQGRAAVMAPPAFLATFDQSALTQHRQMMLDVRLVAHEESLQITVKQGVTSHPESGETKSRSLGSF